MDGCKQLILGLAPVYRSLEISDRAFEIDPEFNESEFLAPMFGIFNDGKPFVVKVLFSPWVARWIVSFGRDAEFLEPEHLRCDVTYDVEVMGETYGLSR